MSLKTWKQYREEEAAANMTGQQDQQQAPQSPQNQKELMAKSKIKQFLNRLIDDAKDLRHIPAMIGEIGNDISQYISNLVGDITGI
jgi:hypothetical protein